MDVQQTKGWPEDATYDVLIGNWSFYQRKKGHKTSTDDVLTAWFARHVQEGRRPERYLDLGCGIGSVLLMTCHALRPKYTLGIEAQDQSALMAKASINRLGPGMGIDVLRADFRTGITREMNGRFDLVTGSPPYFPQGAGTISKDPQRAACRFELRGGVEAYCEAAAQAMSTQSCFVMVFQTQWEDRVMNAARASNLHLRHRADIQMRTDRPKPFLSLYAFGFESTDTKKIRFAIRDEQGNITPEYRAARTQLGLRTSN